MAQVYDFNKAKHQKDRWGMTAGQLYHCSLYKLILGFVKATKEHRLDPFDKDLAMWVEELSYAVISRCKNKELKEEAQSLIDGGVWASYKKPQTH